MLNLVCLMVLRSLMNVQSVRVNSRPVATITLKVLITTALINIQKRKRCQNRFTSLLKWSLFYNDYNLLTMGANSNLYFFFFFFFFFFLIGFYGPFKNMSLISSRSFIKGGRGSNHSGEKPNGLRVNSPIH